ncbi:MAG TPA: hypothetical protein VL240_12600 [Candidatus Binatia bacterium]|nr:hypothetical protein [Candidatus Binatia bacterium]
MNLAPNGGAMNLDGEVMNTGDRPVIGAVVELSFRDGSGKILENIRAPLMGMAKKGTSVQLDSFASDPLKPNDARPFRITVDRIPAGSNHQLPEMRVVMVSAEGGK